jgi:hypothetical protein
LEILLLILLIVLAAPLALLRGLRWRDKRMDDDIAKRLEAMQPEDPPAFQVEMVDDLPAPARRFFVYAIRPGTRLRTVCRISMRGRFGLGTRAAPNYVPMRAEQVLASPHGFVWRLKAGRGPMRITGSDAAIGTRSWSRFWVAGIVPVARAGGTRDHALSAFARHVAEAVFWTPAALLPQEGIMWEAVDDTTARVTVRRDGFEQSVEMTVDAAGRPVKVSFLRWSDANPEKTYRFQPFGGYLSKFREFDGFTLPSRVEAGNFFGQEDYFPFFLADVDDITFP